MMADHGTIAGAVFADIGTAAPVPASHVRIQGRVGGPIKPAAGQYVMYAARYRIAALGECGFAGEAALGRIVQVYDVGGNQHAPRVMPGTRADALACIHAGRCLGIFQSRLRAQVRPPCQIGAGTGSGGQCLAVAVSTLQASQVAAFAQTNAGDEKTHGGRRLCRCGIGTSRQQQANGRESKQALTVHHDGSMAREKSRRAPALTGSRGNRHTAYAAGFAETTIMARARR
jgi:hypothetical protein